MESIQRKGWKVYRGRTNLGRRIDSIIQREEWQFMEKFGEYTEDYRKGWKLYRGKDRGGYRI